MTHDDDELRGATRLSQLKNKFGLPDIETYLELWIRLNIAISYLGLRDHHANREGTASVTDNVSYQPLVGRKVDVMEARNLIAGKVRDMTSANARKLLKEADARARKDVPWAYEVQDELADLGVPFSWELFESPGVALKDYKPGKGKLFSGDLMLASFASAFSNGSGETAMLQQATPREVGMLFEFQYKHNHRLPGTASPYPGLTIGTPGSPIRETEVYKRYMREGGEDTT